MAEHDETSSFVGLPNFLRYNRPENPNVVKGWERYLDLLPECGLKKALLERVKHCVEGLGEQFAKALPQPFRKGMPNSEREQKQKQKPDTPPKSPKGDNGECDDVEIELVKLWSAAGGVRPIRGAKLTDKRRRQLSARISEPEWDFRAAIAKFPLKCVASNPSPDAWKPDIDWFLKPDSVQKILEGKYDFVPNGADHAVNRRNSQAVDDPSRCRAGADEYRNLGNGQPEAPSPNGGPSSLG
jgi:hypothetical protein